MIQSGNFKPSYRVEKAIQRFWMSFTGGICSLRLVFPCSEIPGLIAITADNVNLQS